VRQLPAEYASFIESLAGELPVGPGGILYSRDALAERNETYETATYCPGHVAIGDDGGGRAIVIDLVTGSIGIVDHGAMTPDCIEEIAADFATWRDGGFRVG
jgi:hypothetical protein